MITAAKFDVAISTACSGLDYIVVETTTTAQACVELLCRENLGVATFMILVFILLLLAERLAAFLLRLIVCGKRYPFFIFFYNRDINFFMYYAIKYFWQIRLKQRPIFTYGSLCTVHQVPHITFLKHSCFIYVLMQQLIQFLAVFFNTLVQNRTNSP